MAKSPWTSYPNRFYTPGETLPKHAFLSFSAHPNHSYSTKFGYFQTEDLQLATLIDIAFFTLSTFPLLKLQFYAHAIIFSLSSKYCITFSYSTLARVHTHRSNTNLSIVFNEIHFSISCIKFNHFTLGYYTHIRYRLD